MDKVQAPIRTGLLDFIRNSSGCQFVIPVYQRNYTWTAGKEVKQYLDDLTSVLNGEYNNHFLGILIYLDTALDFSAREFSVIDGQQRLTTTFLTLYAVKAIFKEQGQLDEITQLEGQYLTNPFSSAKIKYKLKPLVSDDEVYRMIVEDRIEDIEDTDSNVYKNYTYIVNYLKDLIVKGKSLNEIIMAINSLYVVCIPIGVEDNAQKIFESINATGVKLTASDLIRNFILMDLPSDTQEQYYAKYWKGIENNISTDSKKLELFFRQFLAVKNLSLPNKSNIYREFVKWYKENVDDTEDGFKEILRYAEAYNVIYRKNLKDIDSALRNPIKEYRRSLSDMPAPVLMELYIMCEDGKISEEIFGRIINLISVYLIRRALCDLDTSSITRMFPTLLKDVLNDCSEDYSDIYDVVVRDLVVKNIGNAMYMPDDEQLFEAIYNANMYNLRATLRVVLDRMETEGNPAPVDLNSLSVEHLMPQTPTKDWLSALNVTEDVYQKNLNRLGNLTLAAKSDNSAMGNKLWDYKNEILKSTSHLKINEEILNIEQWNVDEIDNRTKQLITRIAKLYPYPQVSNISVPKIDIFINSNGVMAMGYFYLDDGSVEIDVGSELYTPDNAGNYPEVEEQRQELIDDGIVAEVEGKLQFVKPYRVYTRFGTSLSAACNLIVHGNKNGWQYWQNAEGIALKDVSEVKDLFSNKND